jgi:hypothetical protein
MFRVYGVKEEEVEAGDIKALKNISNYLITNTKFINMYQLENCVHSP